jgi:hypothetical protein
VTAVVRAYYAMTLISAQLHVGEVIEPKPCKLCQNPYDTSSCNLLQHSALSSAAHALAALPALVASPSPCNYTPELPATTMQASLIYQVTEVRASPASSAASLDMLPSSCTMSSPSVWSLLLLSFLQDSIDTRSTITSLPD